MKLKSGFSRFWIMMGLLMCAAPICLASDEPELTLAVRHKNIMQVVALLAQGADIEERDEGVQQTPLMRAAQVGEPKIAQILLARRADIDASDDDGNTALMFAVKGRHFRVVRLLLKHGADPTLRNAEGETALTLVERRGDEAMVRLLRQPDPPKSEKMLKRPMARK